MDISRLALSRGLVLREESKSEYCLVLGSCGHPPFKEGVFDSVVDVFTFDFVRRKGEYLGEVFRVLRPGGILFLKGHRKETGAEPHSIDQGVLLRDLRNLGMRMLSLWVSQSGRSLELEAAKSAPAPTHTSCDG